MTKQLLVRTKTDEFYELDQEMARNTPHIWEEMMAKSNPVVSRTDCASNVGVAVSLIDGMIATSRVLCGMDLMAPETQEALKDLASTLEIKQFIASWLEIQNGRILGPKASGVCFRRLQGGTKRKKFLA